MQEPSVSKEFVPVYTANGQLAGEMIRLFLESVNIPAMLSRESAGATYGLTVGPLGIVQVLVPTAYAKEAIRILQDMDDGKLENENTPREDMAQGLQKSNKFGPGEIYKDQEPED